MLIIRVDKLIHWAHRVHLGKRISSYRIRTKAIITLRNFVIVQLCLVWGFCLLACIPLERLAIKCQKCKRPVPCRHLKYCDSASRHLHPLGPHWPQSQVVALSQRPRSWLGHAICACNMDYYFLRATKCQDCASAVWAPLGGISVLLPHSEHFLLSPPAKDPALSSTRPCCWPLTSEIGSVQQTTVLASSEWLSGLLRFLLHERCALSRWNWAGKEWAGATSAIFCHCIGWA